MTAAVDLSRGRDHQIGRRVAYWRMVQGMTQWQLAMAMGMDQPNISRIETGDGGRSG